ncbi:MAG TPA: hypothetical protein PKA30_15465 [Accumulibacter sp.]|uniref:hypothetical protein n=1 Tax=Accumulibacter sp. TaxID=2053492 RepID=UPI00287ADC25|nr:hypothetical protein [Accumulibacter sp.]MDS4053796.1 hypothetical protein [Accumulibacter sp.]HMV06932.1 hypothetical protein [Accumulibacter sp.]HMW62396.1 hypothetical protein [Accumulibacter sp.]HMW81202.1 hypothetical protein [Accumulibacter sp.]HMX69427.1 hypothetical protein [Accumulibacter sp.]
MAKIGRRRWPANISGADAPGRRQTGFARQQGSACPLSTVDQAQETAITDVEEARSVVAIQRATLRFFELAMISGGIDMLHSAKGWRSLVLCLSLALALPAVAATTAEVRAAIGPVRDSLMTMLKNPDKRGPDQQALVKTSADKVSNLIRDVNVTPDKKAKLDEMKKIWTEFNRVRETQVVPLIVAGNTAEAEKLVTGEQKERLMAVIKLCDELK